MSPLTSHLSPVQFSKVTVGGTFDQFHRGHVAIIDAAFSIGKEVYLGITTDAFIAQTEAKKTKYPQLIESYAEREAAVQKYIASKDWLSRVHIIPIEDRFGTTLDDQTLEAIVVSPETELVATEINLLRAKEEWSALEVTVVPWVLAQDGQPIHSARIREGTIDREGQVFTISSAWGKRQLSPALREKLARPLGVLIEERSGDHERAISTLLSQYPGLGASDELLVSVGDAVTAALLKSGVTPQVAIVDLCIQRRQVYKSVTAIGFNTQTRVITINNPAATLSYLSFTAIKQALTGAYPVVVQVSGEEDLLTLAVILAAPLGTKIVYGQPHEGIVVVTANEEKKREVLGYLKEFS